MFEKIKKARAVIAGVLMVVMLLTVSPVLLQATEETEAPDGIPEGADSVVSPAGYAENHTVRPGDTLWGLARERGLDPDILAAANELPDSALLLVGQELLIPKGNAATLPAGRRWMLPFWPAFGVVSSVFGPRDGRQHEGIDIAAEEGTPIRAVKSGRVVFAGERGAYGNAVIIDHGRGLRTLYAHALEVTVEKGEVVEEGQEVALVGNTGRSTGPHLHFELLYRGTPLNPARYLPRKD